MILETIVAIILVLVILCMLYYVIRFMEDD